MRNRAKCKLCNDIIESKQVGDFVTCKCGQISIDGGPSEHRRCLAHDWANFVYLDDDDNERPIKVSKALSGLEQEPKDNIAEEKAEESKQEASIPGKRAELMEVLKETLKNSENLPPHVKSSFVTYSDLDGLVSLIYAILREP